MTGPEIATIASAATVLTLTPGPETILTVRLSALRRKAGIIYSLGSATGLTVWVLAALTGVSALLKVYPSALFILKIVGGLYLCFLGLLAARAAKHIRTDLRTASPPGPVGEIAAASDETVGWAQPRSLVSYRRGLISSLSNPKIGLFFLAVMPTLVPSAPTGIDYTLMVAIVVGLGLVYQVALALIAGLAAAVLQRRSTDFWIEAVSAGILIVMGIIVALLPV